MEKMDKRSFQVVCTRICSIEDSSIRLATWEHDWRRKGQLYLPEFFASYYSGPWKDGVQSRPALFSKNNTQQVILHIDLLVIVNILLIYSLWGRFGLRNDLSKTELITDPCRYVSLLRNHRIEIQRVDLPIPGLIMLTYKPKKCFISENPTTNVVISLYTSSAARIRLLKAMEDVHLTPGCELLYTDTVKFVLVVGFAYW